MSKAFDSIMAGLRDALAFARGELDLPVHYASEAELDQHPPPKRKVEGSNPSGSAKTTIDFLPR